jgi:hypothetical protein
MNGLNNDEKDLNSSQCKLKEKKSEATWKREKKLQKANIILLIYEFLYFLKFN